MPSTTALLKPSIRAHSLDERTPFPSPFDSSLRQQEP
jgi:hypothetical protein